MAAAMSKKNTVMPIPSPAANMLLLPVIKLASNRETKVLALLFRGTQGIDRMVTAL